MMRYRWTLVDDPLDVEDTDDETVLHLDLPGVTEEDVEITATARDLVVRGQRRGRWSRSFERTFRLDERYDPDRIDAHLANGVLTIRLGKVEQARPRRIKLTSGGIAAKVKGLLGDRKAA